MPGPAVRVQGVRELKAALKTFDAKLPRELTKANRRVVSRVLWPRVQARARAAGGSHGKAVRGHGIRVFATSTAAGFAVSSNSRTRWGFGAEFGSKRYGQFNRWVGNQWTGEGGPGYAVQPTIAAHADEIPDEYEREIGGLIRSVDLD